MFKIKNDCADVYCITLNELQTHRDALIQNIHYVSETNWPRLLVERGNVVATLMGPGENADVSNLVTYLPAHSME